MNYPNKIIIVSDGNELEYIGTLQPTGTKNTFIQYRYTKSKTKKGQLLGLTPDELDKGLRSGNFKQLYPPLQKD